ncbi:hypothetical protein CCS92_34540, partial [Methylobacterium radiotolerans]
FFFLVFYYLGLRPSLSLVSSHLPVLHDATLIEAAIIYQLVCCDVITRDLLTSVLHTPQLLLDLLLPFLFFIDTATTH